MFRDIRMVADRYYYHSDGDLVVAAGDKEQAEQLIENYGFNVLDERDWSNVTIYDLDRSFKPNVYAFPGVTKWALNWYGIEGVI